jgi:hypothetical protein
MKYEPPIYVRGGDDGPPPESVFAELLRDPEVIFGICLAVSFWSTILAFC